VVVQRHEILTKCLEFLEQRRLSKFGRRGEISPVRITQIV
jgi:hypothetical protein